MHENLDELLTRTFDDRQLSRNEKSVLRAAVQEEQLGGEQLARLRNVAFKLAAAELTDPKAKQVLDWVEDVVRVLTPRPPADQLAYARFSPGSECLSALTDLIGRAKTNLDICVFTITDDRISEQIVKAHQRNVAVRIITDNDKSLDRGSDVDRLAATGIAVRTDDTDNHMHHKFALFDNRVLATGSYNWTRSAAKYNQENILVTDSIRLARSFGAAFEKLWVSFDR